jgi:hypothetical protein
MNKLFNVNKKSLIVRLVLAGALMGACLGVILLALGIFETIATVAFTCAAGAVLMPVTVWEGLKSAGYAHVTEVDESGVEVSAVKIVEPEPEVVKVEGPDSMGASLVGGDYGEAFALWIARNLHGPAEDRTQGGAKVLSFWLLEEENCLLVKQRFFRNTATVHFSELFEGKKVMAVVDWEI